MAGTARSQSTDPFNSNRFHVVDTEGFLNLATPAAGFNTCTTPDITLEHIEYKEGVWTYRRKYPGETTFAPVTMTKGVVKNDSSFAAWIRAASENLAYRTNVIIKHYHRDDVSGITDYTNAIPSREYHLFNCIPIRVKISSDLDGLASDIAIEDLDVEYESFRLFVNGQEVKAAGA
jgi:phage tail-like protein